MSNSKKTEASKNRKITKKALAKKKVITVTKKTTVKPKVTITKPKPLKTRQTKKEVTLNIPTTKEQQAGIPAVVSGDTFEGVKRIDHLPLAEQIDTIFNPLHSITKTSVSDAVSDSTFIVMPAPKTT
jgi:hypothetical protein